MAYQHDSEIVIYRGLNFIKDYENVLLFDTVEHQHSFFNNDVATVDRKSLSNCAYIRWEGLTGTFRFNLNKTEIDTFSYGYFVNPYGDDSRRYYFFITDIRYVNENVTDLVFEIDIMQTYMFDYELLPCYIERAHQDNSDNVGDNLITDNIAVGNMVNTSIQSEQIDNGTFWTVVAVSEFPDTLIAVDESGKPTANWLSTINYYYGLLPSALTLIVVDSNYFNQFIDLYNSAGKIDAIYGIYAVPDFLGKTDGFLDNEQHLGVFKPTGTRVETFSKTFSFHIPNGANGYIPKNKKLLTAPYCQLVVMNTLGDSIVFDPEKFSGDRVTTSANFKMFGDINPEGGVYCCPINYDNNILLYDNMHMLKITDNVKGSWISDAYLNFSAVQDIKNDATVLGTVYSTFTDLLTGNVSGAVSGVVNTAVNINTTNKLGEVVPDSVRGSAGTANVEWANNNIRVNAYWRTPDAQTAESIDNFWTMYGYPQKRIYLPNLFSRKAWNYIKTQSCLINNKGIPSYIVEKICNVYNKGVRFWHVPSPQNIGNYSLDNGFFGRD